MGNSITFLEAAEIALESAGRPLTVKEIIREVRKQRILPLGSTTPEKTFHARLSVDILRKGEKSLFVRVGKGSFDLRSRAESEYIAERHVKKIPIYDKRFVRDRVLAFPIEELEKLGTFHGIKKDYLPYVHGLLNRKSSSFIERIRAEATEEYKQVVSYILIRHQDRFLRFTRGQITNVYQYLLGEYSLGFGGHVQERDVNMFSAADQDMGYLESVRRELYEELRITVDSKDVRDIKTLGVLNDDSSPLGRKHFAFVHLLELEKPEVKKGEISINDLAFVTLDEISSEFEGYEYWSKLCLQTFFGKQLHFDCHVHSVRRFAELPRFILITGSIGSGKTQACMLLNQKFGYIVVPCSKILAGLLGVDLKSTSRKEMQQKGLEFIQSPLGNTIFCEAIADFMKANPGKKYVIDGLRFPSTLKELAAYLDEEIKVMYIEATFDSLLSTFRRRAESMGVSSKDFYSILNHPVEREIERFLPMADVVVYNHGSLDSYLLELENFFLEL